jgi:hypothetical protein
LRCHRFELRFHRRCAQILADDAQDVSIAQGCKGFTGDPNAMRGHRRNHRTTVLRWVLAGLLLVVTFPLAATL